MNRYILIVIALAIIAGAAFLSLTGRSGDTDISNEKSAQGTDTGAGANASDFDALAELAFTDYEGNPVSLSAYRGKPVIVNSWAAWCPFCRQELPDFGALQKEFGEKITVVAIDRQESLQTAKGYTDSLGITPDLVFLLDSRDAFYKKIGGFTMPETLFISAGGKVVVHKRGFMDLAEMRQHANAALTANSTSQ